MTEEQSTGAQPSAVPAVTPSTTGPSLGHPVRVSIQRANHDEARVYTLSEANAIGLRYQSHVLKQATDPENWFSLYELRKISPPDPKMHRLDTTTRELIFETCEAAIESIERVFKQTGYEAIRRPNFMDAAALNMLQMIADMGYMMSLLVGEHDWKTSVMYHHTQGEPYDKPKYLIVADVTHTPKSKVSYVPKNINQAIAAVEDDDGKGFPVRAPMEVEVSKKLDFASVQASPRPERQDTSGEGVVVDRLLSMVKDGCMSLSELSKVVAVLEIDSVSTAASSGIREVFASSKPDQCSPWHSEATPRHVTTVLQNVSIKAFDVQRSTPEEARIGLSKLQHSADISRWTASQRLRTFENNLTNPARHWFKQRSPGVQGDWYLTKAVFKKKYCTDATPARLMYYKLSQKPDELATNYLYRLNAAAHCAGFDYRRRALDLHDHLQHFFDTLHDKGLQMPFRFRQYSSIDELEDILTQYENAQVTPSKKRPAPKKGGGDSSGDPRPSVNKMDMRKSGPRNGGGQGSWGGAAGGDQDESSRRCEECGKAGHDRASCFWLMKCECCEKVGHTTKFCRQLTEQPLEMRRKVRSVSLSADEAHDQLEA